MSEYRTIQGLSEPKFDIVLNQLLNDQEFRDIFLADPKNAFEMLGISLTKEQVIMFENIRLPRDNESR